MAIIDKIKKGTKYVAYLTLVTGASFQTYKLLQNEDGSIDIPVDFPLKELLSSAKPTPIKEEVKMSSMDEYFEAHKGDLNILNPNKTVEVEPPPLPDVEEPKQLTFEDHIDENKLKAAIEDVKEQNSTAQQIIHNVIEKDATKKIKQMMDHHKKHHKSKKYCVVIKYQPDTSVGDLVRDKLSNKMT